MAEKFENICAVCSKSFITEDEVATICDDCWHHIASQLEDKIEGIIKNETEKE